MLWRIRTSLMDRPGAIDELVVSAGASWTPEMLAALCAEAGCTGTTVRPCQADVLSDGPTRYLRSVLRLLEEPTAVDEELEKLQGLNEYTAAEWARADVLVEIAARVAEMQDRTVGGPRPGEGG